MNECRLTAKAVRQKIPGLPELMEWWEGSTFVACVLNYQKEENLFSVPWTHFTLVVYGREEKCIKHTMLTCKICLYCIYMIYITVILSEHQPALQLKY